MPSWPERVHASIRTFRSSSVDNWSMLIFTGKILPSYVLVPHASAWMVMFS